MRIGVEFRLSEVEVGVGIADMGRSGVGVGGYKYLASAALI